MEDGVDALTASMRERRRCVNDADDVCRMSSKNARFDAIGVFQPEGLQQISPGQRPGNISAMNPQAL
jgi:hypothetical protein